MENGNTNTFIDRSVVLELLRAHQISPTRQRVEIGQILFSRPQHLSADQLLELVVSAGHPVSKATVYNTLNLFARKGLIREIIVDPVRVFYDSSTTPHHHFFNVDTGMLSDVPAGNVVLGKLPALPENTTYVDTDVIIRIRSTR